MTDRLVLLLLVGACLLFGAILFAELAPGTDEDAVVARATAGPDAASPTTRPQSARPEELITAILARPLFSSTRRPPQDASSGPSADSDLADARLTGIVTTPSRRIAIFAISSDKPLKVAEGDDVSGWRIESITPREVSLSGPSGTKTLQPKLDPNLAAPAGQPAAGQPGRPPARPPVAPVASRPRVPVPGAAPGVVQQPAGLPANAPRLPPPARLRQQRQ
jgi:general secretion pathway protein N